MCEKKINLGQFFTKGDSWLQKQVIDFIKKVNATNVLDPFVGAGDIFKSLKTQGLFLDNNFIGYDIDENSPYQNFKKRDSLIKIENSFNTQLIVTNPPYLSKNSAKRKKSTSYKYFIDNPNYDDLYLIALEKCLENHDYIVAIIPETFINSGHFREFTESITIIEDRLFSDTDCPICVVCLNKKKDKKSKTLIYKGNILLNLSLEEIENLRPTPTNEYRIQFNIPNGNIGLRAIDGVNENRICFCKPEDILKNYPKEKIGISSRSITILDVDLSNISTSIDDLIENANKKLNQYREETHDVLLAPFKGNTKKNQRRRRLDFKTARAILEGEIKCIENTQNKK